MQERIIWLVLLLLTSNFVSAKSLLKVYDQKFQENQTFYMYSGGKGTIRFTGLPSDIDLVQIVIGKNVNAPQATLIGARNKVVERSSMGSELEFNLEITEVNSLVPQSDPIELLIKTFRKTETGSYEVVAKFSNYIRTKTCVGDTDEVCALIKTRCRGVDCDAEDLASTRKTFKNQCEADKQGADLYHRGACVN